MKLKNRLSRPVDRVFEALELALFYNCATPPERGLSHAKAEAQVADEVNALLSTDPLVLGLAETIGYRLPFHHRTHVLVRDTSRPGRANVALYVRRGHLERFGWVDLHQTWGRTEHPGQHPPRSILHARVDGMQVIVAHQPPRGTDNVAASQREGIEALTRLMGGSWQAHPKLHPFASRRPRLALADWNAVPHGPGSTPLTLADAIGGTVAAAHDIDNAVVRNLRVLHVDYPHQIGGVTLRSDHKHALRLTLHGIKRRLFRS